MKKYPIKILSWLFIILTFLSAYLISVFEEYNIWFLGLLLLNIILGSIIASKADGWMLKVSRIAVGLLFIYSGFVKGVDPLGTQFRIEDYFYAYGTLWALPFALILSLILNAFEFSLGVLLLLKLKTKYIAWLVFLLMIFFTITTLNDAVNNPVPDCGCFGDALIISNWQTFYKNLVIGAFVMIIFLRKSSYVNLRSNKFQWSAIALIFVLFEGFEILTVRHLPFIDFRPWKVGTRLLPENPQPANYFFTYKNTTSGEEKEFLSTELPWQDTVFMAQWSFVSSREDDPNRGFYKTFPMMDAEGNDLSKELVSMDKPIFFMVVYNIEKASKSSLKLFDNLYRQCQSMNWEFYLLNSDVPDDLQKYRNSYKLEEYPVLNSDDTSLKAAIRSNPGLIIVRNSKVIQKFNWRDIPSWDELKKIAEMK